MMKVSIAFLAALSLAGLGCRKTEGRAGNDAVATLGKLKDKVCACKDKACSDKVSEELALWGQEQELASNKPDEQATAQLRALKEETAQCLLKLEVPGGAAGAAGGAAGAAGAADGSAGAAGGAAGAADGATGTGGPAADPAGGSAASGSAH